MKKFLSIVLAAALLFGLCACSPLDLIKGNKKEEVIGGADEPTTIIVKPDKKEEKSEDDHIDDPVEEFIDTTDYAVGNKVKKAEKRTYIPANNISFIEVEDPSINEYCWYFQITGLKDAKVEQKINDAIKDTFYELADSTEIPPYRGVKAAIKNLNGMERSMNVYVSRAANFANILSVTVSLSVTYSNEEESIWFNDQRYLNFDLNTGKPVKLDDLFIDGIDGIEYLNEAIRHDIATNSGDDDSYGDYYNARSYTVLGEFPGLKSNQKYFVDAATGNIVLAFDYDTPWVQCRYFNPVCISFDISDVSALSQRFTGKNIYLDDRESYWMFDNPYDEDEFVAIDLYDTYENYDLSDDMDGSSIYIEKNRKYYSSMPSGQYEFSIASEEAIQAEFEFMKAKIEELEAENNISYSGDIWHTNTISRCGDYTTVTRGHTASISDRVDWNTVYFWDDSESRIFKGDSTEPLKNEDFFKPGTDYKELLKSAALQNSLNWYVEVMNNPRIAEFVSEVYDTLNYTLTVSNDGFYVQFGKGTEDESIDIWQIIDKYAIDPENNSYEYFTFVEQLSYLNIGCEYLTMFE